MLAAAYAGSPIASLTSRHSRSALPALPIPTTAEHRLRLPAVAEGRARHRIAVPSGFRRQEKAGARRAFSCFILHSCTEFGLWSGGEGFEPSSDPKARNVFETAAPASAPYTSVRRASLDPPVSATRRP